MNKIRASKFIELSASTVALLGIVLVVTLSGASRRSTSSRELVVAAKWCFAICRI